MSNDAKLMSGKEMAETLKKNWPGQMTEKEIAFLRDVEGLVTFAIRNGLSFARVISVLRHDVNEISRHEFDIEKTESDGFLPQVAGYSELTSDSFGDSDEQETG